MWANVMLAVSVVSSVSGGFHVAAAPAETLWVEVAGAGEAVVLVPGLFGSAFGYRKVLPLLHEAGYRTIVIEPLGLGRSGRPPASDYSLSAHAERIAAVMDALGERGVLVVAHSVAAAMVFRLAVQRPDLVRGIVSLDGGAAETMLTPDVRRALRLAPLLKLVGGRARIRREVAAGLLGSSGDRSWVTDDVLDAYVGPVLADLDQTLRAFKAMAGAREPEALHAQLPFLRAPVLLLVGGAPKESGLRAEEASALSARLPALTVETLDGVGHYVHEERPAAVAAAVVRLGRATTSPRVAESHNTNREEASCVRS